LSSPYGEPESVSERGLNRSPETGGHIASGCALSGRPSPRDVYTSTPLLAVELLGALRRRELSSGVVLVDSLAGESGGVTRAADFDYPTWWRCAPSSGLAVPWWAPTLHPASGIRLPASGFRLPPPRPRLCRRHAWATLPARDRVQSPHRRFATLSSPSTHCASRRRPPATARLLGQARSSGRWVRPFAGASAGPASGFTPAKDD